MTQKLIVLTVLLSACAATHKYSATPTLVLREKSPGLFVGHTDEGEVVVAASHYDAMNGLAVMDTDLGLQPRNDASGAMLCRREVPTGSHVPHWMCRYEDDVAHERQLTLNTLQQPWLSPSSSSAGGGGGFLGAGGPAAKTQQR